MAVSHSEPASATPPARSVHPADVDTLALQVVAQVAALLAQVLDLGVSHGSVGSHGSWPT